MLRMKEIAFFITGLFFLAGCASGPSSFYRANPSYSDSHLKVAIVPFANLTSEKDADRRVASILITHVLKSGCFDVIEVGESFKALKDAKIRADESLSIDDIKKIGEITAADFLLMGAVEEYKIDSGTMMGEKVFVPEISIVIRLVSTKDGAIVWSANHHRRGDDRVTVFGMGRIDSISELMDVIIADTMSALTKVVRQKGHLFNFYRNGKTASQKAQDQAAEEATASKEKEGLKKELADLKKEKDGIAGEVTSLKNKLKEMDEAVKVAQAAAAASPAKTPAPSAEVQASGAASADGAVEGVKAVIPTPAAGQVAAVTPKPEIADPRAKIKEEYKTEFDKVKAQYP